MLVFSPSMQVYLLYKILIIKFIHYKYRKLIKCIMYHKTLFIFVERIEVAQPKGKNRNSQKNKRNNHSKYVSEAVVITLLVVSFILAAVSSIFGTLFLYNKCLRNKKSKLSHTDVESGSRQTSDSSRRNNMRNETIPSESLSVEESRRNILSPVRYVRCRK